MLRIPGQVIRATGELQRSACCSSGLRQLGSADRLTGFEQWIPALPGFKPGAKQQFEGKLRRLVQMCHVHLRSWCGAAISWSARNRRLSSLESACWNGSRSPSSQQGEKQIQTTKLSHFSSNCSSAETSCQHRSCWHVTFLYMCAETKNSADHVHFWVIPLNFCATCGSSVEIPAKFFAVIRPQFNNNYLVSNIQFESRPKPFLRAKYQNSAEISKRGKLHVKLSEIWVYLPTYLSRLWRKQRRAGRSSKRWVMTWFCFCFRDVLKSDRLIWDASKIKESTSNKPKAQ